MRAVVVRAMGGPEVLEVVDVPVPVPGVGQVRIRVAGTLPLNEAGRAHRLLAEGGLRGRLVLVP